MLCLMEPTDDEPEVIVCHGKTPFSNPPLVMIFVPDWAGAEVGDGVGVIVGVGSELGFVVVFGAV